MKIFRVIVVLTILVFPAIGNTTSERFTSQRPDSSSISWRLDKPVGLGKVGLIVLAQGSGCLSELHNEHLVKLRSIFSKFAALTVEKYGVEPGDNPSNDHENCSAAFLSHHTVSQRIADYRQIIKQLHKEAWWNGDLVLLGGSEGGMTVAILAQHVHPKAVILISSAGGVPFGQMVRESMPKEMRLLADAGFAKARMYPESSEKLAGQSLHFWADAIDRRFVDDMLRSEAEFLLIQGGLDRSAPIGAARATSDIFASSGRCNLTYWEFPGYDHGMVDVDGRNRMGDVLNQAKQWLDGQLAQSKPVECAGKKQ